MQDSSNEEVVPTPEETGEPKLRNAHKFLIDNDVDVDEDYEVFAEKMRDDEKLSNLHKYFKSIEVDVDDDFETFKSKMIGSEPVKKKDEFGSASEELYKHFGENSTVLPEVNIKPLSPLQEQQVPDEFYGKSYKPGHEPNYSPFNLVRGLDFKIPAKDKSAWEKFKSDPVGYAETAGNSFMRGLLEVAPATLETVAAGANWLDDHTRIEELDKILGLGNDPGRDKEVREYATFKAAEKMRQELDFLFPTNASYAEDIIPKVTGGFGTIVQMALAAENPRNLTSALEAAKQAPTILSKASALAGQVVNAAFSRAGVMGAVQTGAGEFKAAKEAGATDDQAFEAATINAIGGAGLEAMPIMSALKRFNIGTEGTLFKVMANATVEGLEELVAETTQQFLANLTAKQIYDKTRELAEGVKESGEVAYITGTMFNAMLGVLGMKRRGAKTPEERKQLQEAEAYLRQQLAEQQAIHTITKEQAAKPQNPNGPLNPGEVRNSKDTEKAIQISTDGRIMKRRSEKVKEHSRKIINKFTAQPTISEPGTVNPDPEIFPTPDQLDEVRAQIAKDSNLDPELDFEGELHQTNSFQYPTESVGRVLDALEKDTYADNDDLLAAETWAFRTGKEVLNNNALSPEEKVSTLKMVSGFIRDIHDRVDEEVSKVDKSGDPIVNRREMEQQVNDMREGKKEPGKLDAYGDPVERAPKKPVNEPNPHIAEIANKYSPGGDDTLVEKLDIDNSKRIADAYEAMEHNPNDPEVQAAYQAMKDETKQQWDALTAEGYVFEPWEGEGEPYASSADMAKDLKENKHLWFFQTEKGFGESDETFNSNPLTEASGVVVNGKDLLYNDLFRAVHDAFGHGKLGNQFGAIGEENAWRTHVQMYSPAARRAVTTETRGQNSWVNFGPHMRNADGSIKKKGDEGFLGVRERPFADQKVGLLPEEFSSLDGKKPEPVPVAESPKAKAEAHKANAENRSKKTNPDSNKKFLTPDEQIADAKKKLSDIFSGKTGKAYDVTGLTAEVIAALGELAVGYSRKGINSAADFISQFRKDFPTSDLEDKQLEEVFVNHKPEMAKYSENLKTGKGDAEFENTKRLDPKKPIDKQILKLGTDYDVIGTETLMEQAQSFIDEKGLDYAASEIVRSNDTGLSEELRGMIGLLAAKEYHRLFEATNNIDYANAAADLEIDIMRITNSAGRTLATVGRTLAQMRVTNPKMQKAYARREAARERNREITARKLDAALAEAEALRKELKKQLAVTPPAPAEIVPEAPKKKKIEFSEKAKKSISAWFDALKVPTQKDVLSSYLLPPAVWNGAMDHAKKLVMMTLDKNTVLARTIDYIANKYNGTWNQSDFETEFGEQLEQVIANYTETPAQALAEQVLNHVDAKPAKDPDPLRMMLDILFKKAKDHLPKNPTRKVTSALDKITFTLQNYDLMRDQLQEAQRLVMDYVNTIQDPVLKQEMADRVNEFVMAATHYPVSQKEVDALVRGALGKTKPKDLALNTKAEKAAFIQQKVDEVINATGLPRFIEPALRKSLAGPMQREVEKMAADVNGYGAKAAKRAIYTPTGDPKVDGPALRKAVREIAASHYSDVQDKKQSLTQRLIDDLDLDPALAAQMSDTIKRNFDSIIAKEKAKFLADKTKLKNLSPAKKKQFIDQLIEASNMGALTDDKFRDIFANAHNIPTLTDQQWADFDRLTDDIQTARKTIENAKNNPSPANDKDADAAKKTILKAQRDIVNIKEHAPGAGEVFVNTMKLQTLGAMTMFTNLFGNVAFAPIGITKMLVEGALDHITPGNKTTAPLATLKGGAKAVIPALKDTWFHLVNGTSTDKIADMHRNFGFLKGIRNLTNSNLTIGQRFGGLLEAAFAIQNKFVSKGLLAGDNVFRKIAEGAEARKIGALMGLKGEALDRFVKYPDLEAEDFIKYAGELAIFQAKAVGPGDTDASYDDSVTDWIVNTAGNAAERVGKRAEQKIGGTPGAFAGAISRVVLSPFALYARIPVNLARLAVSYALPDAHLVLAMGNYAASYEHPDRMAKANHHMAKAVIGYSIHAFATSMIAAGLMTGDDEEETPKGREAKKELGQANSVNISALMDPSRLADIMWNMMNGADPRSIKLNKDDVWVEYKKIPVIAPIFSAKVAMSKQQDDTGWGLKRYRAYAQNLMGGLFDQGIFMSTLALVDALKDTTGKKGEKLWVNMIETWTNPFVPKTIKDISMASDEFRRDTGGDTDAMMHAMWVQRTKVFRSNIDLPIKYDAWGDPIKAGNSGYSASAYYLYDPMRRANPDENTLKYKIAEAYAHSGDQRYLPPVPEKKQNFEEFGKGVVEMNPEQYNRFLKILGEERKTWVKDVYDPETMSDLYGEAMYYAKMRFAKTL